MTELLLFSLSKSTDELPTGGGHKSSFCWVSATFGTSTVCLYWC